MRNKKFFALKILVGGIIFLSAIFSVGKVFAEIENVTASGRAIFNFGEDDEKIVSTVKNVAKLRAEQAAKEKAGVYVKSQTKVVNGILTEDDISAYTSNNITILNTTYKKLPVQAHDVKGNDTGEIAFMYEATVTAKIDTAGLSEYVKRDDKENIIQQNKTSQENISQISREFDNLQKSSENVEQIKLKLASVNDRILASQKIEEGNKLFEQKSYQGAISKYTDALKLNHNSSAAYYNRANVHQVLQNYSKAIEDYNEAITYSGSNLEAYNNLGVIYTNLKDYDEAISNFSKIISLKSDYATAYLNRGVVHYYLKNYAQSLADFNKAVELGIKSRSVYGNRGIVLTRLHDYPKALKDLNKSVELGTTDGEVYYCRGLCNKEIGSVQQAIKDFAKAESLGYKEYFSD